MRYVAVFGERHAYAPALGPDWRIALDDARALVLVRATGAISAGTENSPVLLIGEVHRPVTLGEDSVPARIGQLMDATWGRYVAFFREPDQSWIVFREPSGRAPCFTARKDGVRLVFSHIEDAITVGWRSDGPDWDVLAAFAQDARIRDGRTGLTGVDEVLPGETVGESGLRTMRWFPYRFITNAVEDRDAARSTLRTAVEESCAAHAREHPRILHLLSGGLDSSVVLGCLRRTVEPDRIRCLTFTQGVASELDELRYAQAAAHATGVELHVAHFNPSSVRLERTAEQINQPRPLGYVYSIENDDAELEAVQAWQASSCTSGAGGDGLFFQLRARTYCADYLLRHGPSVGALRAAFDNARLSRVSIWTALHEGWRLAYGGAVFAPERSPRNPYIAAAVGDLAAGWLDKHPWFAEADDLPPGKRLHVWAVLDCLNLHYPYRRASVADTELPLVSQPVIEAALRIPSWVLSDGGRDRSLVREAFVDVVPAPILARSGKGAMDGYYAEVCAANAGHLRERLIDGELVKRGILDSREIERDLPVAGDPRDGRELLLLQAFALEVWASAWAVSPAYAAP